MDCPQSLERMRPETMGNVSMFWYYKRCRKLSGHGLCVTVQVALASSMRYGVHLGAYVGGRVILTWLF